MAKAESILIVVSDYYAEIAAALFADCQQALLHAGIAPELLLTARAAGALEIPQMIQVTATQHPLKGAIALGCVLRGETFHFDIVANQSAYWLNWVALHHQLKVTNGILTCDHYAQALDRAVTQKRGAHAACALLSLLHPTPYGEKST